MLTLPEKVYLAGGSTDLRKSIDGLAALVQERFARLGLTFSRQTLANWMMYGADQWLTPLFEGMKEHLLKQDILHADEMTLQVLRSLESPPSHNRTYGCTGRDAVDRPSCCTNTVRRVAGSIPESSWLDSADTCT